MRSHRAIAGPAGHPSRRSAGDLPTELPFVRLGHLDNSGDVLPLVVRPIGDGLDLARWAREYRTQIDELLTIHAAILFRGFNVHSIEGFEASAAALTDGLMDYQFRASPRLQLSQRVYSSTEYPASERIFPHCEHAYSRVVPLKLLFCCRMPAASDGETPLGSCRKLTKRLRNSTVDRFTEHGVMYVRNYGDGFGLPWEVVFQSNDRAHVEAYCREMGIVCEWKTNGRLRTRHVAPALNRHPRTGEMLWFNHATFFHVTTLSRELQTALRRSFSEIDLPNNTFYGDGTPIEDEVLDELRESYLAGLRIFQWRRGDLLLIDNMLCCHGRNSFAGKRSIIVGMAEPVNLGAAHAGVGDCDE
jgi:alpha-ketoglutarate-dependent taurine dioxygenase